MDMVSQFHPIWSVQYRSKPLLGSLPMQETERCGDLPIQDLPRQMPSPV